ncbi:TetR/AcrR family transcriptional regulator [Cohnella endophytica]|uniref:TetR/AcrR family transcriptional regulator n=1 Tax=Cohnella endophytica TaxID=2419778 RepID=A0A494XA04_9BACL|nr:TetR/AcrR family transcriptional regulator [Cohnella endophytica]RKP47330.1 TetR/AcrR family transcriptional regulator [Cohnella endophytica]
MTVDRRKQIVEAAAKSFSLFGYKATTMDQVAKLANVGKGTIYTFFANKEELFDEIMGNLIQEMKVLADTEYDADRHFFDNLNRILYRLLDYRERHQLAVKMIHEIRDMGTPKALEGMRQLENAILSYIQVKIRAAIDKGELKPCDPEITAFVMVKLYVALASEWAFGRPPLEKERIAELIRLYLMNGLSAD